MVKENRYTPGPWEAIGCGVYARIFTGQKDRIVNCRHDKLNVKEFEANARLIAAAPELLEACKAAIAEQRDDMGRKSLLQIKLENAIAKAEGREVV